MDTFTVARQLSAPAPADSAAGVRAFHSFCDAVCVAGWMEVHGLDGDDVETCVIDAAADDWSGCGHCNHCGEIVYLPGTECYVHADTDGSPCPEVRFDVTTTATAFSYLWTKLTRKAMPDDVWNEAERLWTDGYTHDGRVLAHLFLQEDRNA